MSPTPKEILLYGIAASPGVSHGKVFRFLHEKVEVPSYEVKEDDQDWGSGGMNNVQEDSE